MRGSPPRGDTASALPCVIFACAVVLATTGCSLRTPGCGNRDVKASLERDARASAEQWMSTTSTESLLPADAQFVVSGYYETSRAENTRECSATMNVGSGDNQVAVPIEYEVIAADDGQVLYRWDDATFGKKVWTMPLPKVLWSRKEPSSPMAQLVG